MTKVTFLVIVLCSLLLFSTAYVIYLTTLITERDETIQELSKVNLDYNKLLLEYSQLNYTYIQLKDQLSDLSRNYYDLLDRYVNLTRVIENITRTYLEYVSLTSSFARVLNLEEVNATGDIVRAAIVYESSPWDSYRNMYAWVSASVRYVGDVTIPVPVCEYVNGKCVLRYVYVENYVQSPSFTLSKRQGDCEDMTILLYAMIKYYQLWYLKTEYFTWIAYIEFSDNTTHTAVFIPASNGRLTILDPAGKYLTVNEYGEITANPALDELKQYSNKWINNGGVKYIELIRVDVLTGNYYIDARGSVEEIATFILEITG
ncbi:MAG: hypothetical protein QW816_03790 [Desulfurococcaceae archaeon]